jgi:hypothetical protein
LGHRQGHGAARGAGRVSVAVTIDRNGGRNQETLFRLTRTDARDCSACHDRTSMTTSFVRRSMYQGLMGDAALN